jgi:hypothetical protein
LPVPVGSANLVRGRALFKTGTTPKGPSRHGTGNGRTTGYFGYFSDPDGHLWKVASPSCGIRGQTGERHPRLALPGLVSPEPGPYGTTPLNTYAWARTSRPTRQASAIEWKKT